MLTYAIKPKGLFMRVMGSLDFKDRSPITPAETLVPWPKQTFSLWMDQEVIGKFKVGDLLTYFQTPPMSAVVPPYFKLEYINELYNTVKFDPFVKQPIVLHCTKPDKSWVYKCPATVRHLTMQEKALVSLQNTKVLGSA